MKKLTAITLIFLVLASVSVGDEPTDQLASGGALVAEAYYSSGGAVSSADDPNFDNTSYLVIDWQDSAAPVLYGYRWSGQVSGEQLVNDVIFGTQSNPADEALYGKQQTFPFGTFVSSFGYDRDNDLSFGDLSDGTSQSDFTASNGLLESPQITSLVVANDSDDSYAEGDANFALGAWEYYTAGANPFLIGGPGWGGSMVGFSDRLLSDNSWDAWYFGADTSQFGLNAQNIGTPEVALLGDFDNDGDVDADDIDFFTGNIGNAATGSLVQLDLDDSGTIDLADHQFHVEQLVQTSNGLTGTFIGDANLDGTVDVLGDAFVLVGNLGDSGGWADGDFNASGNIDVLGDAFQLVGNLGRSNSSASTFAAAATSAVP
ncbi:hypothetical protein N9L06_01860 [Mariniblastus sp.]|nr:hypothetical protein [Mariniblastus sp.]